MINSLIKLGRSYLEKFTLKELKTLFKLRKKLGLKILRPEMVTFTYIGSAGIIWVIPTLILMKKKEYRYDGLLVLNGIAADVIFNNVVTKFFFHRKRPWTHFPDTYTVNSLSLGYSFPSGHALTNATAATIFILINKNNIIWVIPLTGLIALSRLYLFAHYPSDVFFGIIDGVLAGILTYRIGNKIKDKPALKAVQKVLDDDYFFKYSNFFKEPITYLKHLSSDLFLNEIGPS